MGRLEDKKMQLLLGVAEAAQAKIVLSTDWRRVPQLKKQLIQALRALGMDVIGATPCRPNWQAVRPQEIASWLVGWLVEKRRPLGYPSSNRSSWRRGCSTDSKNVPLTQHAYHETAGTAERPYVAAYVAIDDRPLLSEHGGEKLRGHFVHTRVSAGITNRRRSGLRLAYPQLALSLHHKRSPCPCNAPPILAHIAHCRQPGRVRRGGRFWFTLPHPHPDPQGGAAHGRAAHGPRPQRGASVLTISKCTVRTSSRYCECSRSPSPSPRAPLLLPGTDPRPAHPPASCRPPAGAHRGRSRRPARWKAPSWQRHLCRACHLGWCQRPLRPTPPNARREVAPRNPQHLRTRRPHCRPLPLPSGARCRRRLPVSFRSRPRVPAAARLAPARR